VPVYFQNQHTRPVTLATAAGATSSEKDEVSLSGQVLKHSKDRYPKSSQSCDAASVSSEEDRKLPAIPNYARREKQLISPENSVSTKHSISNNMGDYSLDSTSITRSVSEPFNVTPPSRRIEPSSDSATQPVIRSKLSRNYSECARLLDDSQSSFYKAALADLSESGTYPMSNQVNSVEKDEQLARELSQQLGSYPDPPVLKAPLDSDISPLTASNDHLEKDAELARALSQQLDCRRSSSALDSKTYLENDSKVASNNHLTKDAQLAKELARNLENSNPSEALDEEFARRLQTCDTLNPSMNRDQDIALAFKLLEETNSIVNDTSSDEVLAQKLSQELNASKEENSSDEMLARQISQQGPPSAAELCPEQLQILEKIQQDNERKLVEQALRESALSDLPVFQDHRVENVASSSSQMCNNSGKDYLISQEHAIREWAPRKRPSDTSSYQTVISDDDLHHHSSMHHNLGRTVGRFPSAPNVYQTDSSLTNCTNDSFEGKKMLDRDVLSNTGADDSLQRMPIITGRQNSYETQRGLQANASHSKNSHLLRQQDMMRSRANIDLLRRGNDETRTAIEFGRSHVVICQGCRKRLHAPKYYSLVFCPNCDTISPGLGADHHTSTTHSNPSAHH